MDNYYLLLFFQALITIFISGGIAFNSNSFKSKTLALFTLLFGLEILYFIYGTTLLSVDYPQLVGRYYFTVGLIYGPLLYFHFRSILYGQRTLQKSDFLHFIPALILNIFMFKFSILSAEERVDFIAEFFYTKIMPYNYVRALHQLMYAFILGFMVVKNWKNIKSDTKFYLGGIATIYVLTISVISFLTVFATIWYDFKWYYFINNLLLLVIGYILFKNPKFFQNIKKKYSQSSLSVSEMKAIREKIMSALKDDKLHLNNNFSLEVLAEHIKVKPHYISQTFSNLLGGHMNDFINKFRIDHAKELLLNSQFDNYKIEAIGYECGFNNKVTFYKAFSKFEGITPAAYKKASKG